VRVRVARYTPAVGGLVVLGILLAGAPVVVAAPQRWQLPVEGSVVRPFRAPVRQFGSGHRGVDLAAAPGTAVRAANDGVVVFAGSVAGSLHVVVAHDGGIRTSSSFLSRVDVRVGQRVARGAVIGVAGGSGDGHGAGVLHLGVRVGDRYVDPMLLFGPVDLTEIVRLVPVSADGLADTTTTAAERRAIAEEFLADWDDEGCAGALGEIGFLGIGDVVNGACGALVGAAEAGLDAMVWAGGEIADAAKKLAPVIWQVVQRIASVGGTILEAVEFVTGLRHAAAQLVAAAFEVIVAYGLSALERLQACPQPAPKPHGAGSGNLAMVVAGLGSSRRRRADGSLAPSAAIDREVLGYRKGEVAYFSYDPDKPTYRGPDTFGDLHAQARSLGEQLRALEAEHPGRSVDLIGHSQGGVVISLFLAEHYRGHEADYPPIANVVTFASPLQGTPTASVASAVDDTIGGRLAFLAIKRVRKDLPLGSKAIDQLDPRSSTIDVISDASFEAPRFLSVMASQDLVVPSTQGDVSGGKKVVVNVGSLPWPFDDHTGIMRDDDAKSAAQAHLAGGAPVSCGPDLGFVPPPFGALADLGLQAARLLPPGTPLDAVVP